MRVLTGLLATAVLVLAGCGATTATPAVGSAATSAPAASSPGASSGKSSTLPSPVPVPGWADDIVTAGDVAYAVGWNTKNSGALWQVDATGNLSLRTAPPGMPGNPGLSAPGKVLMLAFDSPDTGMAITGVEGDMHHRGHKAIYVTDDGARTWTRVDLPTGEQPDQVAIGHGAAYVLTSNCPIPRAACDHATLWSVDPTGTTAPHTFDTLPTKADTTAATLVAANADDVWVLLDMGGGSATAVRSQDGGRTWHRFDAGLCLWEAPVATSGSVLWATCSTGMLEHFTRQAAGTPPVGVFPGDVGGTTSSALIPLTDSTAYAVIDGGHGARVEATHDGGDTTTTVAEIPRSIARRGFRTTFVSQQVGYLVTLNGGELYRTDDGAHSWHEVSPPHP